MIETAVRFSKKHRPMIMIEPALHYSVLGHPGHLRFGAWWNGGDDHDPSDEPCVESYGWYMTWDQEVWAADEGAPGVGIFLQYGWAPEDRSVARHDVGAGVQWTGLIPTRDQDAIGIGLFHVRFSEDAETGERHETTPEVFYKIALTPWLSIKPDIQYIAKPGGSSLDDAFAIGVRCRIAFSAM